MKSWSKIIKSLEVHNHAVRNYSLSSKEPRKIQEFVPMNKKEGDKKPQEEYSRLIQEAKIEAKKIKEDAYREGVSVGKEEALKIAQERVEGLINEMRKYLEGLKELEENLRKENKQEMVELALAIARKIIIREIRTDPDTINHIARAALEKTPFSSQIKIRVNPEDYKYMAANSFETKEYKDIVFEPDSSITPGGCYLETEFGDIDARWEERLKEIERLFDDLINQPDGADKRKRRTKKPNM